MQGHFRTSGVRERPRTRPLLAHCRRSDTADPLYQGAQTAIAQRAAVVLSPDLSTAGQNIVVDSTQRMIAPRRAELPSRINSLYSTWTRLGLSSGLHPRRVQSLHPGDGHMKTQGLDLPRQGPRRRVLGVVNPRLLRGPSGKYCSTRPPCPDFALGGPTHLR